MTGRCYLSVIIIVVMMRQNPLLKSKYIHIQERKTAEVVVTPPGDLPRVRVEHDLSEAEKRCDCGYCLNRINKETSFQYDVIPTKFQVIENAKFKYACQNSKCGQAQRSIPTILDFGCS